MLLYLKLITDVQKNELDSSRNLLAQELGAEEAREMRSWHAIFVSQNPVAIFDVDKSYGSFVFFCSDLFSILIPR